MDMIGAAVGATGAAVGAAGAAVGAAVGAVGTVGVGAAVGTVATVVAVPVALSALGFSAAGGEFNDD